MQDSNGNILKTIGKLTGSIKEARASQEADALSRDNAPRILSPDMVQGKAWRATKVLTTTLNNGGIARPITKSDLLAFNVNTQKLAGKFSLGVTADEVIKFSTEKDKKRAKDEIHHAVPNRMQGGDIHFITNAGPDSKKTRHHVRVILEKYEASLVSGTPLQAAKFAAKSNIKFDCDCERHTFVFRYLTTKLGANAGRAESGFPKIRNPTLNGIACKHVLRVMIELNNSIAIWKRIAMMVDADRKKNADKTRNKQQKVVRMTQKEASQMAKKQDKTRRAIKEAVIKAPAPKKVKASASRDKALKILIANNFTNAGLLELGYTQTEINNAK